jgi:hypothetical protein
MGINVGCYFEDIPCECKNEEICARCALKEILEDVDLVYKKCADKHIKKLILNLAEEYKEDKGATRFAGRLLKELGLW